MAVLNKSLLLAMAVLAVVVGLTEAQNVQSCASKLVPCYKFLNSNSTTKPDNDCCDNIKSAVTNELPCLCSVYNTPGVLQSFNVSVADALRLSRECGVSSDISACNSTAASPSSVPPPPGTPGSDGGAGRVAWTGISSLLLFFASMLFY